MDKPIGVGDLVVIVTSCCERSSHFIGLLRTVRDMDPAASADHCEYCGVKGESRRAWFQGSLPAAAPLQYLKRIPPIEELEGEKRDEEITA